MIEKIISFILDIVKGKNHNVFNISSRVSAILIVINLSMWVSNSLLNFNLSLEKLSFGQPYQFLFYELTGLFISIPITLFMITIPLIIIFFILETITKILIYKKYDFIFLSIETIRSKLDWFNRSIEGTVMLSNMSFNWAIIGILVSITFKFKYHSIIYINITQKSKGILSIPFIIMLIFAALYSITLIRSIFYQFFFYDNEKIISK